MSGAPTTVVTVPLARLRPDAVPQVCLKTGEAAQCLIATRASATPSWAWLLVVPGGVPFLAARRWLFPSQDLALPARNLVYDQWQLVRRAVAGGYAVGVVLVLWSLVTLTPSGLLGAAFAGAATTGGWLLVTPRFWVGAELEGDHVKLYGVHTSAARVLTGA